MHLWCILDDEMRHAKKADNPKSKRTRYFGYKEMRK
jgi:hypothetical protein